MLLGNYNYSYETDKVVRRYLYCNVFKKKIIA